VRAACRPLIFGDARLLAEAARRLGMAADWPVVDLRGATEELLFAGRASREGGEACLRYLHAAAEAVRNGEADALVTAPINKEAIGLAGCPFGGHTDLLADLCCAPHHVMMLAGGPLRVALVTHHVPLAAVSARLTTDDIVTTARIAHESLCRYFDLPAPRLAVCGLNPHASDGGRFGHEEADVIEPAIAALRQEGIQAQGPVPPDTCFLRAVRGEFDAVVAMYHDQGLIPLKLLAFDEAVNVTLGLPIIRTSPDHGTAYDIAGKGVASPASMIAAILLAARMSQSG